MCPVHIFVHPREGGDPIMQNRMDSCFCRNERLGVVPPVRSNADLMER